MWQWLLFLLLTAPLMADVSLDKMMNYQETKETGVHNLSYSQKRALEQWIDDHFEPKAGTMEGDQQLYLSLNIDRGAKLEFSDGSTYEIDPEDRLYTAYWITPFPVLLGKSDNPDYPVRITNLKTNTSVNGKKVSTKEVLEEERKKIPSHKKKEEAEILQPEQKPAKKPQTKPSQPKGNKS